MIVRISVDEDEDADDAEDASFSPPEDGGIDGAQPHSSSDEYDDEE